MATISEACTPMSSPTYDPTAALDPFNGDLTWDRLTAHLNALRADPAWRVFVFGEGIGHVCDIELIYQPTTAWYALRLKKVRRVRGVVWRRAT